MNILHVYPISAPKNGPSRWMKSQIESLESFVSKNYTLSVLDRRTVKGLIIYGLLLRKEIKLKEIDVVHCHWGASLALFTTIFSSAPVVVSFCGSDLLGNYSKTGVLTKGGRISRCLSLLASLCSNLNIVKSRNLLNSLPFFCHSKTSIIPNGVDSRLFYQRDKVKSRIKLNLPTNKFIILFVDRPGAWVKNPKMARDIGYELEKTEGYFFLEVSDVPYHEMVYYYSAADFLLSTSHHEGSSNALKEALCCNLKVVTTPTGDSVERLKNIPECKVSCSKIEIINFIKRNKLKKFESPFSAIEPIKINTIAKRLCKLYHAALV